MIPVIDGGIKVRLLEEGMRFEGADWQTQTVGPERTCLACLDAYNPGDVSTEKDGHLEDPSYLDGLPFDHAFKRNENVFPFSTNLASLEVLRFVELVTGIGSEGMLPTQRYSFNHGHIRLFENTGCREGCWFTKGIALGDSLFPPPVGVDHSAIAARERQRKL